MKSESSERCVKVVRMKEDDQEKSWLNEIYMFKKQRAVYQAVV